MVDWHAHMTGDHDIICKPTADTFVRFFIVLAAFFGFGLYFFYDGMVGYWEANEVYASYHAFAKLGQEAETLSAAQWDERIRKPLFEQQTTENHICAVVGEHLYPVGVSDRLYIFPGEAMNQAAMAKSWSDCWAAYTQRLHFPIKPAEHGYDTAAIREQWYAGGACMLVSLLIVFLMLRTRSRVLALQGDLVTAAGQQFRVADISRLDLRQWGPGFKGVAYATVQGRKVRMDGMTYGGFNKEKGEPAERWMKALLAQYKGDIIEYEQPRKNASSAQ